MRGRAHLLQLLSDPNDDGGGEGDVFASAQWPQEEHAQHSAAWGRPQPHRRSFLATSWVVPEEEKLEPGWPVALQKYYRRMIQKEEDDRLEAAMWKVAAERKAARAQDRGQVADAEAEENRVEDQALKERFQPTLQEQIATESTRLKLAAAREGIILREMDQTKQHLAADELRDAERDEQVQSLQREADYIQGLKDAERENELRMEHRNMTPGEPAVNAQGKVITRKFLCEAERNTVFQGGKCIVGGEEDAPDTAEEIGATTKVNDSQDVFEEASAAVRGKAKLFRKAQEATDAADQHVKVLKDKLAHAKKPSEAKQEEIKAAEAELTQAQKQQQEAQVELDRAKAVKASARKKHHAALEGLLTVQDDEEHHDEDDIDAAEQRKGDAEMAIERDEDNLAEVEEDESRLVGHHAQDLKDAANHTEGYEREHLGAEAGSYKIWALDADAESKALRSRDSNEVVRLHGVSREDALSTGERHREVLNDMAVNGGGPELLKPNSLSKSEEEELNHDNSKLGHLMEDEKKSEEKVSDSLSAEASLQEHKNMVGLRRASTLEAMTREAKSGASMAALCASAVAPAFGRHRRPGRRPPPWGARKAATAWGRFL